MKTDDQAFVDWEESVFGYGYGTGEEYTLAALKTFFDALPKEGAYNHSELTRVMGAQVCWLMINTLCHADIIDYGTSPRYGWLTKSGEALRTYLDARTVEDLCEIINRGEVECGMKFCNCDDARSGKCQHNPFFPRASGY